MKFYASPRNTIR